MLLPWLPPFSYVNLSDLYRKGSRICDWSNVSFASWISIPHDRDSSVVRHPFPTGFDSRSRAVAVKLSSWLAIHLLSHVRVLKFACGIYLYNQLIFEFIVEFWTANFNNWITGAMAQWVRALAPQAEGWVFESQLRQTQVVIKVLLVLQSG